MAQNGPKTALADVLAAQQALDAVWAAWLAARERTARAAWLAARERTAREAAAARGVVWTARAAELWAEAARVEAAAHAAWRAAKEGK